MFSILVNFKYFIILKLIKILKSSPLTSLSLSLSFQFGEAQFLSFLDVPSQKLSFPK